MTPEQEQVTAAVEAVDLAKQRCDAAHLERDAAAKKLGELVGVPDRGHKVLIQGEVIYDLQRIGDQYRCTITRIDHSLPF